MREILFKAKRIDNGEWVEGNVILSDDACDDFEAIIIPKTDSNMFTKHSGLKEISCDLGFEKWHKVDKDTICQYTGLTDKNGNKIWENDLIECEGHNHHFISQIEWDEWCKGFMFQDTKNSACGLDAIGDCGCYRNFKVIGTTFDNPELLGG